MTARELPKLPIYLALFRGGEGKHKRRLFFLSRSKDKLPPFPSPPLLSPSLSYLKRLMTLLNL